jgi:hypothetical protein
MCEQRNSGFFNIKLHEIMETVDYMKIIQVDLSRNDFTQLGLHLNISGKEKMTKLLGDNIQELMSSKEEKPLSFRNRKKIYRTLYRKKIRQN